MNPRDQAEAGGGDPPKTVQLDDTYKLGIVCAGERGDNERSAHPVLRPVSISMPRTRWDSDPEMHALRFTYSVAVAAHAACSRALTEATMGGAEASPELIGAEAKSKARMAEARAKLHSAMALPRRRP